MRAIDRHILAGLACLASAAGCIISNDFSGTSFLCTEEPVCPDGFTCVDGRCVSGGPGGGDGAASDDPDAGPSASEFRHRRKLTFANADRGPLEGFPVLVLLDPDRIEYGAVREDGADVRFFDADGAPLPHEIETWQPGGVSALWVRVPRIDGDSADDFVWMYYGDPDAAAAEDEEAVWTAYRAVYHLNPAVEVEVDDSTAQGYDGTAIGTEVVDGRIGPARSFDGVDDAVDLGTARDFASGVSGMTVEAWVRPGAVMNGGVAFGTSINGGTGSRAQLRVEADLTLEAGGRTADGGELLTATAGPIPAGEWTWVAVSYDLPADTVAVYVDGALATSATGLGFAASTPATPADQTVIGVDENLTSSFFLGAIDEVRLAVDAKGPDWIAAQHAAMTDQLVSFGPAEAP